MNRNMVNFVIDLASAAVMAGMIATGLILRWVLPPGSGSHRVLWGWGRHDWGDLHFWMAAAAGAIVILHVALHWQWVCVTLSRCIPRGGSNSVPSRLSRNVSGAVLLVVLGVLLGGFVWIAGRSVEHVAGAVEGHGERHRMEAGSDNQDVRGSMTLAEVAQARGLSIETVRMRLGLPADTPATARLGVLAKAHGLTMSQARQRLAGGLAGAGTGTH